MLWYGMYFMSLLIEYNIFSKLQVTRTHAHREAGEACSHLSPIATIHSSVIQYSKR